MKGLKRALLGLAAVALPVASANAGEVIFDPTGSGNFNLVANPAAFQIEDIDWVSNTAITPDAALPLTPGATFDTFAHSRASAFNGGANQVPNLSLVPGNKSELTFVTGFQSVVTAAALVPGVIGTAQFELNSPTLKAGGPNFFEIYWDPTGEAAPAGPDFDAADIAGSPEFRDGILILRGSIVGELSVFNTFFSLPIVPLGPNSDPDAVDSPLIGSPTAQGTGAIFDLTADIDFIDTNYLQVTNMEGFIKLLITDGNLRDPFLQAEPSTFYYDGTSDVAVVLPAVNGLSPGNFIFEHDSATVFVQAPDIPEPATAGLALMGLVGLAIRRRRHTA